MDVVIRLLLRFILVPLGAALAVAVAAAFVIVAHWNTVVAAVSVEEQIRLDATGLLTFVLLSLWALNTLAPAAIGVLISETFAIRSWLFHAANGGLSAWIGWTLSQDIRDTYRFLTEPKVLIAAGLAAGLTYWLVAGRTAGFWKPVRAPRPPLQQPVPPRA
jgi:hypothetical protein